MRRALIAASVLGLLACRGDAPPAAPAPAAKADPAAARRLAVARGIVELAEARVAIARARRDAPPAPAARPAQTVRSYDPAASAAIAALAGIDGHVGSLAGGRVASLPHVEFRRLHVDGGDLGKVAGQLSLAATAIARCRPAPASLMIDVEVVQGAVTTVALPPIGPTMACIQDALTTQLTTLDDPASYRASALLRITAP